MPDKAPNWIVVADPLRAKIYAEYGTIDRTYPVFGAEFTNPPAFGSGADNRAEPDEARRRFLGDVIAFIEAAAVGRQFNRLIVVASSPMIDEFRSAFDGQSGAPEAAALDAVEFVPTDEPSDADYADVPRNPVATT